MTDAAIATLRRSREIDETFVSLLDFLVNDKR